MNQRILVLISAMVLACLSLKSLAGSNQALADKANTQQGNLVNLDSDHSANGSNDTAAADSDNDDPAVDVNPAASDDASDNSDGAASADDQTQSDEEEDDD